MNSTRLVYAYHLDRDFFLPLVEIYQPLYGVIIVPLHLIAFYLLLVHTKNWVTTIRACYFLNQAIMFTHDVWTCFLFRGYHFLPNPIAMCAGLSCGWIGPFNSLIIEHIFMIHSIFILFVSLLMMHQQVAKLNSFYVLPSWIQIASSLIIYISLWTNGIVSILTSGDVPNAREIIEARERQQLNWLRYHKEYHLMIFGEVGNCGPYRYEVYVIVASIILLIPVRALLVGSSVRLLRQHSLLTSRAMKMRKLYISVLLRQTTIISIFYVYPLLLSIVAFQFQIAFLPDYLLAFTRIGAVMSYMFQSIPQFYVLISANRSFRNELMSKICFWKDNRISANTFSLT